MITKYDAVLAMVGLEKNFGVTANGVLEWYESSNEGKPTEAEIQAKVSELEAAEPLRLLREERDQKLAATDWRATVDYPGDDKQLWLDYRQALRDITLQDTNNVIWPSEPA